MKTSDSIAKIAPALLKSQQQVADATKNATNPHFKSKYAPLEEVIGVCKAALNANGISFMQGGEAGDGDALHLTTRLVHESGEWIESTLTMKPSKNDPQGIGSAITYARRYSLAAMCGVASEEDDDGNAASQPQKPASKPSKTAPVSKEPTEHEIAVDMLRELFQKLPESQRTLKVMTGILPISDFKQVQDCTVEQLNTGIDRINALLEGK